MKKLSLLVFVMMATWMVTSCTPKGTGCYGYWEGNRWGLKRGTIAGWNANYKKPYRQCVEGEVPHKNGEKRPYG
jgi:hypothetical protein